MLHEVFCFLQQGCGSSYKLKTFFELIESKPPPVVELTTGDEALGILAYRFVFDAESVPGIGWDSDEVVEVGKSGVGEDESAHGICWFRFFVGSLNWIEEKEEIAGY